MNILNENELKQINALKRSFSTPATFQALPNEAVSSIADWTACLMNALDAFGAEHFVVSCIGMLKAGKSTLINLLARSKDASPTGFGFDTTLRPALTTSSTETRGTIEIWLPNTPEQKLTKTVLNEVFLCLRKVKKPEDVKGASCHAYPLTPANLENALSSVFSGITPWSFIRTGMETESQRRTLKNKDVQFIITNMEMVTGYPFTPLTT